jgi:hypothetical protein
MKSIFDPQTSAEIIGRINSLNADCRAQWGKMNVTQMVRHCSLCEEYYMGEREVKRSFLGRIFGKMAIKGMLKDDQTQLSKNAPTSTEFKVTEGVSDLDAEKEKWKKLIELYGDYPQDHFNHWFFGRMTKEQLGQFVYKHCDHHLRQFAC